MDTVLLTPEVGCYLPPFSSDRVNPLSYAQASAHHWVLMSEHVHQCCNVVPANAHTKLWKFLISWVVYSYSTMQSVLLRSFQIVRLKFETGMVLSFSVLHLFSELLHHFLQEEWYFDALAWCDIIQCLAFSFRTLLGGYHLQDKS